MRSRAAAPARSTRGSAVPARARPSWPASPRSPTRPGPAPAAPPTPRPPAGPRGPLNPALYRSSARFAFHDIRPSGGTLAVLRNGIGPSGAVITRLRSLDHDSSLATAPGWDDVTGLGSPDAVRLLWALR